MFKIFITCSIGGALFLISLGLFVRHVNEFNANKQNELQSSMSKKTLDNTKVPAISLEEAQRRVLGYKEVPFKAWSPNDPKPEPAILHNIEKTETDSEGNTCLENDCRWTRIN